MLLRNHQENLLKDILPTLQEVSRKRDSLRLMLKSEKDCTWKKKKKKGSLNMQRPQIGHSQGVILGSLKRVKCHHCTQAESKRSNRSLEFVQGEYC